jgi:CHAP domain
MKTKPQLPSKLVELATAEIGVEEIDGSNCGPRVNEYKGATNLPAKEAWPWCAAFICWLVREAIGKAKYTFKRPTTAGAWALENWSRAQDDSTNTKKPTNGDIRAGDIVIFTFSHVGLAVSKPDEDGYVQTVEGNTDHAGSREGGGVWEKQRHVSKIRSRIRFTV